MKQQKNNEMDLLLRRLGGRDGDAAREAPAADKHLDADELSSYAQNALPATVRTRYTEHLAECATCRKLVTELSLSMGTVAVAEPGATVPVPTGLQKFLANLFSPLVLRYAVPVLGVMVVMIVGFVVLRQQRSPQLVARNEQAEQKVPVTAASPSSGFYDQQPQTPQQVESHEAKPNEPKQKSSAASGQAGGIAADAPAPSVKDERSVADLQPRVAPAATPAASKAASSEAEPPATVDSISKKQAEVAKTKADDDVVKERAKAIEPARNEVRVTTQAAAERQEQNKPKAAPSQTSGFLGGVASARPGTAARRTAEAKRKDETSGQADQADEEIRTIAGRRFRKARGIWTDTAYDSSTATVNMARDSEQFRALVADEPAIGTIAKQLDGEFIVVWKGRVYRIR